MSIASSLCRPVGSCGFCKTYLSCKEASASSAALTISMPAALSTACLSPTCAVHSKQLKPKPCTPHPALLRQERVKEVINQQVVDISTVSKLSAPLVMRGGEKRRPRTSILSGQFCQALRWGFTGWVVHVGLQLETAFP